jgi:hypothetical protein
MPIQKFRSLDEASAARRCEPRSAEHLRRLRFTYAFWSRLRPRIVVQGVHRYRSIEEANAARDAMATPRRPGRSTPPTPSPRYRTAVTTTTWKGVGVQRPATPADQQCAMHGEVQLPGGEGLSRESEI